MIRVRKSTVRAALMALAIASSGRARAENYFQQANFNLPQASVQAAGADAGGNVYLLERPSGQSSYSVAEYAFPNMTPRLTYGTAVSSPAAFAVQSSGATDILDASGYSSAKTLVLRRFDSAGAFISSATIVLPVPEAPPSFSAAIDAANGFVYVGYQETLYLSYPSCVGCATGPSSVTDGFVLQYDFQGREVSDFKTNAAQNASGSNCITPALMAVDAQGNVIVADPVCGEVLSFSSTGNLVSAVPGASWTTNFTPSSLWTDPQSDVYVANPLCGATGCVSGIEKIGADGSLLNEIDAGESVAAGAASDSRVLYLASGAQLARYVMAGAPSVPTPISPAGALSQHVSTEAFAWQPSQDADGDAINYSVYLGTAPGALNMTDETAGTSWSSPSLGFGATYYWQVEAQGSYDGLPLLQALSPIESFSIALLNNPPGPFEVLGGTGTWLTRSSSATLSWTPSIDPDGDAVSYAVSLSSVSADLAVIAVTTATDYSFPLDYGTTYYWSVTAQDGLGGITPISGSTPGSATQTLSPLFLNAPPDVPNILSPALSSPVIKTMSGGASVSWDAVSDPQNDPITYTVYFGDSPQNMAALAAVTQSTQAAISSLRQLGVGADVRLQDIVSQGTGTLSVDLTGLSYYRTYYLQLAAANPYGAESLTPVETFSLTPSGSFPAAYNYPNPFSPERGGTNIVFNAPASGYQKATVEIYSEWQDLLFRQDYYGIPAGVSQVHFDGRDRYGRDFFDGSYICRVRFSGPLGSTTFFMLVVK